MAKHMTFCRDSRPLLHVSEPMFETCGGADFTTRLGHTVDNVALSKKSDMHVDDLQENCQRCLMAIKELYLQRTGNKRVH